MAYDPTTWNHEDVITSQKLNKIEKGLTDVTESAIFGFGGAQQSSDGLTPLSYLNAGDPMPSNPKKGDTVFIKDGNDFTIYSYDGEQWNIKIDPNLSQRLSDTLKEAKDSTDKAIADNNDQINNTIGEVAQEKVDLAIKDSDFNAQAQAMADKALQDAKDNTATVAQETLDSANDNIAQAKSDITDAYKDADGVISKKIDDTASSINSTISQNKTDAEGKISSAQSTATQALNEVSTKVSQTDYNTKTGDLDTRVTKAQQTADGAVTTVGNYKTSNDARVKATETSIAQNAKDITLRATTTDLNNAKSDYNAQIAQVKVDAGKVETTVSNLSDTVNNISIGGRNLLLNSKILSWGVGNNTATTSTKVSYDSNTNMWHITSPKGGSGNAGIYFSQASDVSNLITKGQQWAFSFDIKGTGVYSQFGIEASSPFNRISGNVPSDWTRISSTGIATGTNAIIIYFNSLDVALDVYIKLPKLETGNQPTDWSPAPEDTVNALASQQVTIDGITNTVSKQGANIDSVTKRVTTAEGTLTTVTNNITGLQTQQTTTANQVTQEISDRKTGDNNTLQSSKDFTTSSITSYDTGLQTQLTQTNSGILATVSANNLVVDSSLMDSAISNSIVNWDLSGANRFYYSSGVAYQGVQSIGYNETAQGSNYSYLHSQTWSSYSFAGSTLNVSVDIRAPKMGGTSTDNLAVNLIECDANMKVLVITNIATVTSTNSSWVNYRKKITVGSSSKNFYLSYAMQGNGNVYIARPYVGVQELVTGGYTAGANNNNQTILSLFKDNWSIGINDNIGGIVSGIVGNASQMSLISKKVVIDSPSTQITGTAWINSAMIQNGSIVNADIADATITNAKIATLDVAKITGDVSSFIQSNWNGTYGSTTITSSGMEVKTANSDAVFDASGLTVYSPDGATAFRNGKTAYISSSSEDIGMVGTVKWAPHPNVDYLMIGLHGYHTTTPGDDNYDVISGKNNVIYGGDGIGFGISNANGGYDMLMTWDSPLVAGYQGRMSGWHVEDVFSTELMMYANSGLQVSSLYSGGKRTLHTQGIDISSSSKWFGFMSGDNTAGFGTDNTQDVIFFMKGKAYSLYTMLGKLGMR